MKIKTSDLVKYNANTRGTNTGDCTARAISLAFNMDYSKARKALNESAKQHNLANPRQYWKFNSMPNCLNVIDKLGGGDPIFPSSKISVGDFADENASGTYLVLCSKSGTTSDRSNHLVCIIDGRIYDSWDSRVYYIVEYWEITSGIQGGDITDVGEYLMEWFRSRDKDAYTQYVDKVFDNIIDKNRKLKALCNENSIDIRLSVIFISASISGFTFTLKYGIILNIYEYDIIDKPYKAKFSIAFKPTMPVDQVEPYFEETFYKKMYSYIQGVVKDIEDICDSQSIISWYDNYSASTTVNSQYAKKCLASLPYWAQKLAVRLNVDKSSYNPGEKIALKMVRLPYDPDFDPDFVDNPNRITIGKSNYATFYAPTIEQLRRGLDYYKNTGNYDTAYDVAADY